MFIFRFFYSWLDMRVVRTSSEISEQTMIKALFCHAACSRKGRMLSIFLMVSS